MRHGGVYLITGGLGSLGLVFARELARQAPITLVLTGRRSLDAVARTAFRELEQAGAQVRHVRADIGVATGPPRRFGRQGLPVR